MMIGRSRLVGMKAMIQTTCVALLLCMTAALPVTSLSIESPSQDQARRSLHKGRFMSIDYVRFYCNLPDDLEQEQPSRDLQNYRLRRAISTLTPAYTLTAMAAQTSVEPKLWQELQRQGLEQYKVVARELQKLDIVDATEIYQYFEDRAGYDYDLAKRALEYHIGQYEMVDNLEVRRSLAFRSYYLESAEDLLKLFLLNRLQYDVPSVDADPWVPFLNWPTAEGNYLFPLCYTSEGELGVVDEYWYRRISASGNRRPSEELMHFSANFPRRDLSNIKVGDD